MTRTGIEALEKRWIQERTAENRDQLKAALEANGKQVWVVADTLFIPEALPPARGRHLADHRALTEPSVGMWQQVLVDLLLFRVHGSGTLQGQEPPEEVFAEMDRMVSSLSESIGEDGEASFAETLEDQSRREHAEYACSAVADGFLLHNQTFSFDLDTYRRMLEGNDESEEEGAVRRQVDAMRMGLSALSDGLPAVLAELAAAGIRHDEAVMTHEVDDSADGHGFMAMPWLLRVGSRHAIAEIRRGTWY